MFDRKVGIFILCAFVYKASAGNVSRSSCLFVLYLIIDKIIAAERVVRFQRRKISKNYERMSSRNESFGR